MHAFIDGWMHIGRVAATSTDLVKKALALLSKQGGPVRLSEALKLGIHRDTLRVMRDQELLRQVSRGLYLPAKGKALAEVTVGDRKASHTTHGSQPISELIAILASTSIVSGSTAPVDVVSTTRRTPGNYIGACGCWVSVR